MPHIFKEVPGEAGSLVFQFNGQFALKNYNVEIINGNRLKVTSSQNELFSLLEVDVTEVEINGIIYNDSSSAQIALQSLVFSNEIPIILTSDDRAAIMAGWQGSVNKTTPTPTKSGFYLCEESGIYPQINNLEALDHFITFFIFNGLAWSSAKIKIPGSNVSEHDFDPTNSTDPQSANQINNWLSTKVEGGEAGGTTIITEEIGSFDKNIGINMVGNDADSFDFTTVPNLVVCKTNKNSNDNITSDRYVSKGNINLSVAGNYKVVIGVLNGTNFIPTWISDTITGVVGWNSFQVNKKLSPNQIIGVTGVSGSTAKIRFASSGASTNNKLFGPRNDGGNPTELNPGSYYSLWFELYNINYIETASGSFNLKKSVSKIVNDFATNNYKSNALSSEGNTTVNSETAQASGYAVNKYGHSGDSFVEKLEVNAQTAGAYTIVIGFVDQWNKLIEKKLITANLTAGVNTVVVNTVLEKNDVLGFKMPSKFPVNTNAGASANLFISTDYGSTFNAVSGSSLPIKLFLREYVRSNIATKTELSAINDHVNSIDNIFTKDGKKIKLIFNSNGTVSFEYVGGYLKTLFMGNSITLSLPSPDWWGTWGMAASEKDKDYAHVYLNKMKVINPSASVNPVNISLWESVISTSNPSYTFDYSTLDTHFSNQPNAIFLKIGENVTWNQYFKARFRDLVEYVILKNPTALIKVCGVFWANANIDNDMKAVAVEKGLSFTPLSQFDTAGNRSYVGAVVKGDDGQNHTITHNGVSAHPGDGGMQAMGNAIFNSLGL
ncbi:hypothetical protein [Chryseobacterium sp.]|uniref:hypothetical protein n=1 Tax=Chryseobacterium sp. TaxID=1871047 RepID=UPI002618198F|nr:hypothetical protein [Chryseobacterium sp.]